MKKILLALTLIAVSTVAFARPHYYKPSRSERNLQTAADIVNITLGTLTGLKILSGDAVIVPPPVIVTPTPTYYVPSYCPPPPPPPPPRWRYNPPPPPPRHYHRPPPPRRHHRR